MRLHFLTRDLHLDYPNIGWLPPLPDAADDLWLSFGNLHAGEYPEVLLSQHRGEWQLYLSAIDSGRTDSVSYSGRIIRVSLYLSGATGEGTDIVLALVSQYLQETLLKKSDSPRLKNIFQTKIKPGDPEKWVGIPTKDQESIATDLLAELRANLPPCPADSNAHPRLWMGGCAIQKNIDLFLSSCREMLSGQAEGMVASLANLGASEVHRVQKRLRTGDHAAFLLTTTMDQNNPIEKLELVQSNPLVPPESRPQTRGNDPRVLFWLGGLVLILIVLAVLFARGDRAKIESGSSTSALQQTNGNETESPAANEETQTNGNETESPAANKETL